VLARSCSANSQYSESPPITSRLNGTLDRLRCGANVFLRLPVAATVYREMCVVAADSVYIQGRRRGGRELNADVVV